MLLITRRQLRKKYLSAVTAHIPNEGRSEKGLKNVLCTLGEVHYPMGTVYGLRVTGHSPSENV